MVYKSLAALLGAGLFLGFTGASFSPAHAALSDCFPLGVISDTPPTGAEKPPGDGAENPYQISLASHLLWMSWAMSAEENSGVTESFVGARQALYEQKANITMPSCKFQPIGKGSGQAFAGVYDGGNFTITGVTIDIPSSSTINRGFFGRTEGATLENIRLVSLDLRSTGTTTGVGGLVGVAASSTTITNSHTAGSVTAQGVAPISAGSNVGGLVGDGSSVTISDSSSSATVTSNGDNVGGLVGYLRAGGNSISNSSASGGVIGSARVGGLVGWSREATIRQSYASGQATGSGNEVGGLVGRNRETDISSSYATGVVQGANQVGGLVGSNEAAGITKSFASGDVGGADKVGGLVGYWFNDQGDPSGSITFSYASSAVTATGEGVGGLLGQYEGIEGDIANSYAIGPVSGANQVGGLLGLADGTDLVVNNVYSVGSVSATGMALGGLLGEANSVTVNFSFWDTDTSGRATSADDQGESIGKTTAEMKSLSTYTSDLGEDAWLMVAATSFGGLTVTNESELSSSDEVWGIGSGTNCGYPFLWWQTASAFASCGENSSAVSLTERNTREAGSPGIFLTVTGRPGDSVTGREVTFGAYAVGRNSPYSLTVQPASATTGQRVLASGLTNAGGHLEREVILPRLSPGSHTIVFVGRGSRGELLTLRNLVVVDLQGRFISLTPEAMQPRLR